MKDPEQVTNNTNAAWWQQQQQIPKKMDRDKERKIISFIKCMDMMYIVGNHHKYSENF